MALAESQDWSRETLIKRGEAVYKTNCLACHQASGEGIDGIFPALKGSAFVQGAIEQHIEIVLNGKSGTAMQAFAQQLNSIDLAAVIMYERNAWGNSNEQMVTPAQIKIRMSEQGESNE